MKYKCDTCGEEVPIQRVRGCEKGGGCKKDHKKGLCRCKTCAQSKKETQ